MGGKFLKFLLLGVLSIVFVACTNQEKKTNLTVSNIVDKVYLAQTTTKELEAIFGKPQKVATSFENVNDIYFDIPDNSVTVQLNASKLYQESSKIDEDKYQKQFDDTEDNPFDSYYQYQGKNLGLQYVRFYVADGVVYDIEYGSITNRSIAKQDKYLRQIMD